MNPADEAKLVPTEGQPSSAVAGSHNNLEEQIHNLEEQLHDTTLEDLQRTNHQSKGAESFGSRGQLDEQLRVSVETLLHPNPPSAPVEEVDDLLLAISHRLDDEASERKKIHNRLRVIENEMGRLASRGFRYLVALCIGLAAILAWQSYGEVPKQIIATRAPELGWSPQTKQMIAGWMQQLGWTKPLAVEIKAAPEKVAAKQPTTALDPQQIQQIEVDIAAVRQAIERHLADVRSTVEQLTTSQDQMARQIGQLQNTDKEILEKISAPPPQPQKRPAPARKYAPTAPPSSRAPIPPHPLPHP